MSEHSGEFGEDRAARIGRALDSFVSRRERGEPTSEAELLRRHPDLADELRMHLDLLDDLPPVSQRIDALIAKGLLSKSADSRYLAELGEYGIVDYLGRGGMGIVLKAYEPKLDRVVALKILRPDLSDEPAVIRRFEREARAAAALKHQNIVTVFAVGSHNGTHFIAMEYVPGPSLAEVVRATIPPSRGDSSGLKPAVDEFAATLPQPLPEREGSEPPLDTATIREIFRQLLTALAAAHEAGLIHRDVKSSNILLDQGLRDSGIEGLQGAQSASFSESKPPSSANPQSLNPSIPQSPTAVSAVKLADFGLARLAGGQTTLTAADSILGTPEYMSPEQARGDADIDHRSDLYSAGVVLYEMLTGRVPFKADTPTAVLHQIIHTDPPDPRTVNKDADPALASLALRLMRKERGGRLESADAVSAVLASGARAGRPMSRVYRRRLVGALSAVGIVGLGLGAWVWLRGMSNTTASAHPPPETEAAPAQIREIRVEPVAQRHVEARYGDSADWRILRWDLLRKYQERYKQSPEFSIYTGAVMLNAGGQDLIVVGCGAQFDDDRSAVVAFDLGGARVWRLPMNTEYAAYKSWPDCPETPRDWWPCRRLAAGDLDGITGDELIVAAGDHSEYPSRISLVDPISREIRSTFWHAGDILGVFVIDDLLPDDLSGGRRAGIVVWAVNNKLDGFDQPILGDPAPVASTENDLVPVVMILDPRKMDGIGPPHADRFGIPPAMPWAYAFLDVHGRVDEASSVEIRDLDRALITAVYRASYTPDATEADSYSLFSVSGEYWRRRMNTFRFLVDDNLALQRLNSSDWVETDAEVFDWKEKWRPIIRRGGYAE